jgi:hypothetical protein
VADAIQIVARYDGSGLLTMMRSAETLASPARYERALHEGARAAGDKVRTVVRKALQRQTGVKRYAVIVKATRSYIPGRMQYAIDGSGKGLPITDFPVRARKVDPRRFHPKLIWQIQKRDKMGRFKGLKPLGDNVSANVWGVAHRFKRSYEGRDGIFRAILPEHPRGKGRRLFGPSPAKEIVKAETAAAFNRDGPRELDLQIWRRLARILAGGGA